MYAQKRTNIAVLIALMIALAIFMITIPAVARAALGLLFVLFIPGYVATYAFFSKGELDLIERISCSVALSISFVVLAVMFSNTYLNIPIRTSTVIAEIIALCFIFALIAVAKKSPAIQEIYAKAEKAISLKSGINSKTLKYVAFVIILALLAVNFSMSVTSEKQYKYYRDDDARYLEYDAESGSVGEKIGIVISRPYTIGFENGLAFIGYDLSPTLNKGEDVPVKYYFRAAKDMTTQELTVVTDFNKDEDVSVFQKQL